MSALHHAIVHRNVQAVRRLLESGESHPSELDDFGYMPLHVIVPKYPEDLDIVDILISYGASVNEWAYADTAPTPLHIHQRHRDAKFKTALIQKLLGHGADPDLEDANGVTPMMLAIQMRDASIVELMATKSALEDHLIFSSPDRDIFDVLVHHRHMMPCNK